ncbi:MAG TPA: hypothetical protein VKN99_18225 [Polyangia bacterium]|nr:hypothetical protein [Polyangia bacterium]
MNGSPNPRSRRALRPSPSSDHPLLGLWLVQAPDQEIEGGFLPLCGRSNEDLLVLAFRDLPRARACASKLEVAQARFQLVCDANLDAFAHTLRELGVVAVAVDWDPSQAQLGDTRPLDRGLRLEA